MDDAIHPTAIHDDDWEAALVAKANGDVPDDQDCADEGYSADEEEPPARSTLHAWCHEFCESLVELRPSSERRCDD